MTINAYIFMWDQYGIEAIVPITQYENQQQLDVIATLKEEPVGSNPLNNIVQYMKLRATFNPERRYEIYAIDCSEDITEESLLESWEINPQMMADIVRERGVSLFGESRTNSLRPVVIK